ncbi:hypothetical protein EJK55_2051 [Moraxella catarrhalis]|uniref:Uncharacterized protein n=1 Tax=Moraxella catarrhalis TaxID=480 RepID=A0ABY0BLH2_MORCA|nr:hypothetical protein EJK55_2051 [Moraxella catarrhalis]RUO17367.1 hypothetical protein EJK54_2079 [Moraxella catarrhalis]
MYYKNYLKSKLKPYSPYLCYNRQKLQPKSDYDRPSFPSANLE